MADYFIDHGAYVSPLGAVPTWGIPQEGDGSAMPTASTSSIASMTINAVAVAGNTINICGVPLTAVVSGAGLTQFNVGASTSVQATNIANAFNLSQVAVAVGVATGQPQLRNLIYARAVGSVVEVMMRAGSATLNYTNNTNVGIVTGGWGTAPTIVQFIGGVGGCWGTLISDAAMGVGSSYATGLYGYASQNKPTVSASSVLPLVNALPAQYDTTWFRSGNGVTITLGNGVHFKLDSNFFHQHLVLDSNLKWTGDTGLGVFKVRFSCNAVNTNMFVAQAGWQKSIHSVVKNNLQFLVAPQSSGGSLYVNLGSGSSTAPMLTRLSNLLFGEEVSTPNNTFQLLGAGTYTHCIVRNCLFNYPTVRATFLKPCLVSSQAMGQLNFEGCEWITNFNTVTNPCPATITAFSGQAQMKFVNCKFSGWTAGKFTPVAPATPATYVGESVFENCSGLAIGAYVGLSTPSFNTAPDFTPSHYFQSSDVGRPFRYENARGVVDWNPDAAPAYPLLSATQQDGTRWSLKMDWMLLANSITRVRPFSTPMLAQKVRIATGVRTITLEMFLKTALVLDYETAVLSVTYTDDTGVVRSEDTRFLNAISASSASWTNSELYSGYSAKKIALTTQYPVAIDTEVSAVFELYSISSSGSIEQIYIDPQFGIA